MRFTLSVSAVLAMAASAFAQTSDFDPVYTPKSGEVVPAGSTYTITWDAPAKYAGEETISIHLIGGATQGTQAPIADIAAGIKNSAKSYSWTVDASLGDAKVYGLVFKLESNPSVFQYSNPFQIKASDSKATGSTIGSATVTLTTSTGVKTVTLSSSSTPASTTTTSAAVVTSTHVKHNTTTSYPTATVSCNGTSTLVTKASNSVVLVTSTALVNNPTGTAPVTVPTTGASAAPMVRAGFFSVLGGLFVAFFAL